MTDNAPTNIPTTETNNHTLAHGSCVALDGCAVLIVGPSGSGKSALALELMAYGCTLIGDDRVQITPDPDGPIASPPPNITGKIEARGIGILTADTAPPSRIVLVIDLAQLELDRLPPTRQTQLTGHALPLLHKVESTHFPAAILQYLKTTAQQSR